MTGDATQVARIKAEFASRDAAWWEAIKERLARGPATSSALAIACGIHRIRGPFSTFLIKQKRTGRAHRGRHPTRAKRLAEQPLDPALGRNPPALRGGRLPSWRRSDLRSDPERQGTMNAGQGNVNHHAGFGQLGPTLVRVYVSDRRPAARSLRWLSISYFCSWFIRLSLAAWVRD